MDFRNLNLSSLENVQELSGAEPKAKASGKKAAAAADTPETTLPEPKAFGTEEQALRFYLPLIDKPLVKPAKPRIASADAIRISNRVLTQFATDWKTIKVLLSEEQRQRCVEAFYHLLGLRMAWLFTNRVLGGEEQNTQENNLLQSARTLRNLLLTLASAAYTQKPNLLDEIARIQAMSHPNNSLYDELATDLLDTVALFENNKFKESGYVIYPTEKLKEATQLAERLPLFAPKKPTSPSSSSETVSFADAPIHYRAFGLFEAALYQLVSSGRFLRFPDKQASQFYPLLSASKSSTRQDSTDANQDEAQADGTLPAHRPNFG